MKAEYFIKSTEITIVIDEMNGDYDRNLVVQFKQELVDQLRFTCTGAMRRSSATIKIAVSPGSNATTDATYVLCHLAPLIPIADLERSMAYIQIGTDVVEHRLCDPRWLDLNAITNIITSPTVVFWWTDKDPTLPPSGRHTPQQYNITTTYVVEEHRVAEFLNIRRNYNLPTLEQWGETNRPVWFLQIEEERRRKAEERRRQREEQLRRQALQANPHRLLYLDPACPDWLVEIYWKAAVRALHPDANPDATPEIRERLTKMVSALNEGHDLIKQQRGNAWQPALPWKKNK